jgi:CMP-N,N'-diacetyllegionaminic acid synthase
MCKIKILAIIPARSGSKGFINKNIATINGKTLLQYAIEFANSLEEVNDVYVSTDSELYENIGVKSGAKSLGLRSSELSNDNAKTVDVVIDLLSKIQKSYDLVLLLQPTSPLRDKNEFRIMLNNLIKSDADACVSVNNFEEPHPFKLKSISSEGYIQSFLPNTTSEVPRQALPKCLALTGAIYLIKKEALINYQTFLPKKTIPFKSDYPLVNIDNKLDFEFLKFLIDSKLYTKNLFNESINSIQ